MQLTCEGKFLKKGRSDPETDQPTFMFKVGDECSFPKSDIVMILPYPKITGTTKRQTKFVFLTNLNNWINLLE